MCQDTERKKESQECKIESGHANDPNKGREMADIMQRTSVDALCAQEIRWKDKKARNIGAGFKLYYHGVDRKKN